MKAATTTTGHPTTLAAVTAPTSTPVYLWPYYLRLKSPYLTSLMSPKDCAQRCVSSKLEFTPGSQRPNQRFLCLLSLTGVAGSWPQPMTQQLFEGACIKYCMISSSRTLRGWFLTPKEPSKTQDRPNWQVDTSASSTSTLTTSGGRCQHWSVNTCKVWRRTHGFTFWFPEQNWTALPPL